MFFHKAEFQGHFHRRGRDFGRMHAHGGFGRERGSIKYDVLEILSNGPRHGYDIMLQIEQNTGSRPSPGSIYPALQMLEDLEHVTGREVEGKRVYTITAKGSEYLTAYRNSPEGLREPDGDRPGFGMMIRGMRTIAGLRDAVKQIARSGDPEMVKSAVEILEATRSELYKLLAAERA